MNIHNCHDSLNEKCINHKYIIKMGPERDRQSNSKIQLSTQLYVSM